MCNNWFRACCCFAAKEVSGYSKPHSFVYVLLTDRKPFQICLQWRRITQYFETLFYCDSFCASVSSILYRIKIMSNFEVDLKNGSGARVSIDKQKNNPTLTISTVIELSNYDMGDCGVCLKKLNDNFTHFVAFAARVRSYRRPMSNEPQAAGH